MRSRFALTTLLLLALGSLPAFAQRDWGRPHPPKAGACFYRDAGFRGDYFCMRVGDRWPSMPAGFNDQISSIRLFGGARVRLFNDDRFEGASVRIDRDVDTLERLRIADNPSKNWNDRVSSIAVIGDQDEWDTDHHNDHHPDRNGDRH